jgi:hypothetical protein
MDVGIAFRWRRGFWQRCSGRCRHGFGLCG